MKLVYLFLISIVNLNYLCADEPVAIISKIKGKVKYKSKSDNKYSSKIYQKTPIFLSSRIKTQKKAFAKVVYLDDASVISIYPKSEIIIEGSINERAINKQIQILRGIVQVNLNSVAGTEINLITTSAELKCSICSFWILSDESIGDQFILESGVAVLYNSSVDATVELMPDSTVISRDKLDFEVVSTSVTDIRYLESLMLDADEKSIEYKKKESEAQKEDLFSNIVVIKLKNAANEKREIVLTYIQKNNSSIE